MGQSCSGPAPCSASVSVDAHICAAAAQGRRAHMSGWGASLNESAGRGGRTHPLHQRSHRWIRTWLWRTCEAATHLTQTGRWLWKSCGQGQTGEALKSCDVHRAIGGHCGTEITGTTVQTIAEMHDTGCKITSLLEAQKLLVSSYMYVDNLVHYYTFWCE